jgi:predicted kinase
MNRPTLTVTRGLPGSGKTTWAKEQLANAAPGTLVRVNRDELRMMMHGGPHRCYETEKQVTSVHHASIAKFLTSGTSVIADDTNLRSRNLRNLAEIAWRHDAEFVTEDFTHVPLEDCIRRDSMRELLIGEDKIREIHRKFLGAQKLPLPVPEKPESVLGRPYVPLKSMPPAVMVDIDGTVALCGDRDPYDTSRYDEDAPNAPVIAAVYGLWARGVRVIFCSGRSEEFRAVTETWLRDNTAIDYTALYMRPAGDLRRDDIIKLELFDKHIRHQWNVQCVFDDRDRVVQAWRGIGLTVFQVAEGNF